MFAWDANCNWVGPVGGLQGTLFERGISFLGTTVNTHLDTPNFPPRIYEYMLKYSEVVRVKDLGEIDERDAARLAELFAAMSDANRVRILAALMDGERNVGTLAGQVGMTESAVSHQLRYLRQMRLVRARKDGREVFYALDDDHVARLFQLGLEHVQHG